VANLACSTGRTALAADETLGADGRVVTRCAGAADRTHGVARRGVGATVTAGVATTVAACEPMSSWQGLCEHSTAPTKQVWPIVFGTTSRRGTSTCRRACSILAIGGVTWVRAAGCTVTRGAAALLCVPSNGTATATATIATTTPARTPRRTTPISIAPASPGGKRALLE
jgi:hypothetical protein